MTTTRPADRRAHLVAAAAEAFSSRGYHGARLSEIAESAGVSAPALYRHFDGKSELLATVIRERTERMSAALDGVAPRPGDPAGELTALIDAYTEAVLAHRRQTDLYRWERQTLSDDDRAFVDTYRRALHRRVRELLTALRPELTEAAAGTLAEAIYAVANSPSTHRVTLPRKAIGALIAEAALAIIAAPIPTDLAARTAKAGLMPTARREVILAEATRLFAEHGFHEVTIEQIAGAAGLPPSGVYRHFPSKQAILSAVLQRASQRTTSAVAAGLAQTRSRDEALAGMVAQYAQLCAADPAVITVYGRCFGALDSSERAELRRQQRINVDEWATWLREARPQLPSAAARFLVHAALEVIAGLTCRPDPAGPATASALAMAVLSSG